MMPEKQYNLDYLDSISGGDQEFIIDMISTFLVNVPEELAKIQKFIETENWTKAGEESHKFASNLLFLNIENLKMIAIEIEEKGMGLIDTETIPELFIELKNGCIQVIEELKIDFNL